MIHPIFSSHVENVYGGRQYNPRDHHPPEYSGGARRLLMVTGTVGGGHPALFVSPLTADILAREAGFGCRNSRVFTCSSSISSLVTSVFWNRAGHRGQQVSSGTGAAGRRFTDDQPGAGRGRITREEEAVKREYVREEQESEKKGMVQETGRNQKRQGQMVTNKSLGFRAEFGEYDRAQMA